jgi:deazaflavin-dependent oxidoreductase (nitroreductase family)
MWTMTDYNAAIINEFRANEGKVGGPFENSTLLLLHHTGAKTGMERVNPLAYQKVGDAYAVFASKAGAPDDPAWYRNLLAHPETSVEVGTGTIRVRARVAAQAERDEIWARQVDRAPHFGEYAKKAAPRVIPVVLLDPIT